MSDNVWPQGVGRTVLVEVDSTNAEAQRRARQLAWPEWILALKQTSGRGRRGRLWADPVGNFSATLVMRPTECPELIALRSFVASLALYDTCIAVTGRAEPFALKWPNDVLLNGGKLAGILLESVGSGSQIPFLCIGIGVNLKSSPDTSQIAPGSVPPVNLLSELGADVSAEEFLDILAPCYADWELQFTTFGFEPIRHAWLARAAKIGETVTARTMRDDVTGVFETVDGQGNLVLKTSGGRHAIPAADVFF